MVSDKTRTSFQPRRDDAPTAAATTGFTRGVTSFFHPFDNEASTAGLTRQTIHHFIIRIILIVTTCCFYSWPSELSYAFGFQGLFPQDALNL
jgi:hypothetical protein